MTISYNLAPIPKWYIADLTGKPLGGGSMYTYSSLDKTTFKFIYQDPAGNFPWTDPVLFDENGSQGPFYWAFDTAHPTDLYYIEVYDANGVLQWTIDNFIPPGGSGGSIITTAINLQNFVINPVYWRNTLGTSPVATGGTLVKIAPSAHSGLATNFVNPNGLYTGPDIYFIKNNTNAADFLSCPAFTLGSNALTGDVTPVNYLNYTCNNSPAGETIKVVQYPITRSVQNLSNQNVTVTIWARCTTGTNTLTLQWFQFFGDGTGASASVTSSIQTLTLTNSWAKYTVSGNVPDVTGKTLGPCGNDALFLQVAYPLGAATNIDHVKPSVYLGNVTPTEDYISYDMIDATINAPRTGNVRVSVDGNFVPGYIAMNDGTIGNTLSGATTGAGPDFFPLYNIIWGNVSDAYAPVIGGRGADAVSDFVANKPLTLTRMLGRALCASGTGAGLTARVDGEYLGSETISITDMPAHTHPSAVSGQPFLTAIPAQAGNFGAQGVNNAQTQNDTGSTGGSGADGKMQPSAFLGFFIKL
jgi:hypothetical protein